MKRFKFIALAMVLCAGLGANEFCDNADLKEFLANVNDGITDDSDKKVSLKSLSCDNGALKFSFVANENGSKNSEYLNGVFENFLDGVKSRYCDTLANKELAFLHTNWLVNLATKDNTKTKFVEFSAKSCEK
ncbi:MAG: hypothetical protein J6U11_06815 [Campylobacter sp.]|nr:hypothetical protein [Campylobacter sp.]